ncbi:DUF7686 domain-containing protein [Gracilibacillus massiliensis]|uniref:DUF7686 domain-containing protein n=1 Tax=Gracilibacillus massiliensis TaxID=1564956 RepID=UPI00071E28D1|nr:hypothetical protein [Gracilibacillus massiliensis]
MTVCSVCNENEAKIHMTIEDDTQISMCETCHNLEMSLKLGRTFDKEIEAFTLPDAAGKYRHFYIEQLVLPIGVRLEAIESKGEGYRVAVGDELDTDLPSLYQKLVKKTKQTLSKQFLEKKTFPNGQSYVRIKDSELVAQIQSSGNSHGPLLVIDGKPFTWEEEGKMISSFEGFEIEMKMKESTDDEF